MAEKAKQQFQLTGKGYNITLRKADQFGKFKVDLELTDPAQIAAAEKLSREYGLKIKDEIGVAGSKEKRKGVFVTLSAKEVKDGQFPVTFVPASDDSGNEITDFMQHGADLTASFRFYVYKPGVGKDGVPYKGGFGVQLDSVRVHEYTPYKQAS